MTIDGGQQRRDLRRLAGAAGLLSLVGIGALALAGALGLRRETHEPARGGYEHRDAPPKLVVAALAGLLSLVGIAAFVAWAILAGYGGQRPAPRLTGFDSAAAVPAAPRLEVDQRRDRIALERQAEAHLTGYGWTNRAAGLAHIPIDRAMALQAAAGWPDAASAPAAAAPSNASPPPASNAAGAPASNAAGGVR